MTRHLLLLSAALAFIATPAIAQEKAKEKESAKPAEKTESVLKKDGEEAPPPMGAPVKQWLDAENALIDPLSDREKESFLLLRERYSIIKTIGIAEDDIGNAVKSCGDKNPDMKKKMEDRFKQWQNAVNPIIDTAKKAFDRDLANQKIVDVKEAKNVFKLQDAAYSYNAKLTTKQVVTTPVACQGLLDSMDRTEDQMITLLEKTLLPEAVIRQQYERSEKAKAKAQAKARATKDTAAPAEKSKTE